MNRLITEQILVIGAFQSFFLAALLIRKKEKALHDYLIGIWLVILGIYVSCYAFFPPRLFVLHPRLIIYFITVLLLNGPFLLMYVKSLIRPEFKLLREFLPHLLPFLLFNLYHLLFLPSEEIQKNIFRFDVFPEIELSLFSLLLLLVTALSVPFYIAWSISLLRKHRKIINNNFSSQEKRNLNWLRNLMVMLGIAWIILLVIFFIHHVLLFFTDDFCINGLFITLAAFIIVVGYFGLHQPSIFTAHDRIPTTEDPVANIRYAGSPLKTDDLRNYLRSLDDFMNSKKPYLNSELTLYQLAEQSDIPPHHLSRIINEYHHQNFFDYVNFHRVEEFKKRVTDPAYNNFTLLAIAYDCGFNSKTSFNRFFKKITGLTPSEFKIQNTGFVTDH